jgi:hypothetical protein
MGVIYQADTPNKLSSMNKRLLKILLLTIVTAAIAGVSLVSRAQDTNAATASGTSPQKFYGPVTAVDTNAMTFTVGDQTFTVTGESQLTKNNQTATLADAVVGEPARGSYTKGADGKLDITKVRFGKKAGGKAGGKHKKSDSSDSGTGAGAAPSTPPKE